MDSGYLSLTEAAKLIGVSRNKMWKLVKAGAIPSYTNPKDAREKLVRQSDVEQYLEPKKEAA